MCVCTRAWREALCTQARRRRRQLLGEKKEEHHEDPRRRHDGSQRGACHVQARTLLLLSCQQVEVGTVADIFLFVCMLSASVCSHVRACVWLGMRARACAAQGLAAGLSRWQILCISGISFLMLLGFVFCGLYISGMRATSPHDPANRVRKAWGRILLRLGLIFNGWGRYRAGFARRCLDRYLPLGQSSVCAAFCQNLRSNSHVTHSPWYLLSRRWTTSPARRLRAAGVRSGGGPFPPTSW
jgi:hypothetical protein